jgi:hypothetical protein
MSLQTVYVICMMLETPRWGAESSTLGLDLQSNISDLPPRSLKAIMMLGSMISGSALILHVGHTCFCTSVHVLLASLGIYMLRPKNDKPALKSSRPNPHFHQEAQSSASQEKTKLVVPSTNPGKPQHYISPIGCAASAARQPLTLCEAEAAGFSFPRDLSHVASLAGPDGSGIDRV